MYHHRFILEPYKGMKTRYQCPSCNDSKKTFVRYCDTETHQYIADDVGRCDRQDNCGYHYTPKLYFQDNNILPDVQSLASNHKPIRNTVRKPTLFIDSDIFIASLKSYDANNFVKFLQSRFNNDHVEKTIVQYYIGTAKQWDGANVFWQIDINGRIRTGKIMLYRPDTGKRVKEPYNHIAWVHSALNKPEFELKQCLFGEHLLKDNSKPIAIVESEKTAIIASIYLPKFIWLACGSLDGLNYEKCKVLKGRKVVLFPDVKAYDKWVKKSKQLESITKFDVSVLLESRATEVEREKGLDLADYLLKYDCSEFLQQNVQLNTLTPTLKEQFKSEFLKEIELPLEMQKPLWHKYKSDGLLAIEAKEVLNDLITNYGFIISQ
jgi:hypothetical protein